MSPVSEGTLDSVEGRRVAALSPRLGVAAAALLDDPVADGFPAALGAATDCEANDDASCEVNCGVVLNDAADIGEAIAAAPEDGDGVCAAMDGTASGAPARKSDAAGAGEGARVGRCGAAAFAGTADGGSAGTKVAVKAGGAIAAAKDLAGFAFLVALEFAATLA